MPLLKGKIELIKSNPHSKVTKFSLLLLIAQKHKYLNIYIDILCVNITILLLTKTVKVNFFLVTRFTLRSTTQIKNALISYQTKYEMRGLKITDIHGDNKFNIKALKYFLQLFFYTLTKRANMWGPLINKLMQPNNENAQPCHAVPYKRHTRIMMQALVEGAVDLLNHFAPKTRTSDTMSQTTIEEGRQKN